MSIFILLFSLLFILVSGILLILFFEFAISVSFYGFKDGYKYWRQSIIDFVR